MSARSQEPVLFFTAFEPSGDDHAAAAITELRRRHPNLKIYAWGGPKMEAAGAEIIRGAIDDAVVGLPGFRKINDHLSYNRKIGRWLDKHRVTVHIPVDSPAANFPICKLTKTRGIKVVHLVAPQLWAWGGWRIAKLRRRTDHVMCLLPFEQRWMEVRGVQATFVGHPLFDHAPILDDPEGVRATFPDSPMKLAIMPGSRPGEIKNNFHLLLRTFRLLRKHRPEVTAVIPATTPQVEERLRQMADEIGGWPEGLHMIIGDADLVIDWCDAALAVSGTVTLQIARQHKPMVVVYKAGRLIYHLLARWLIQTESFALPNVIAGSRIVPEFIPYFGGPERLFVEVDRLLSDPTAGRLQRQELVELASRFDGRVAARGAADCIEQFAGIEHRDPVEAPDTDEEPLVVQTTVGARRGATGSISP